MTEKQYLEAVQKTIDALKANVFEGYDWFNIGTMLSSVEDETQRRLEALKAQEDNIKSDMWEEKKSRFKTVWGLYYLSSDRTWGNTEFYETYELALDAKIESYRGEWRIEKRTYELEEYDNHDCGDDE